MTRLQRRSIFDNYEAVTGEWRNARVPKCPKNPIRRNRLSGKSRPGQRWTDRTCAPWDIKLSPPRMTAIIMRRGRFSSLPPGSLSAARSRLPWLACEGAWNESMLRDHRDDARFVHRGHRVRQRPVRAGPAGFAADVYVAGGCATAADAGSAGGAGVRERSLDRSSRRRRQPTAPVAEPVTGVSDAVKKNVRTPSDVAVERAGLGSTAATIPSGAAGTGTVVAQVGRHWCGRWKLPDPGQHHRRGERPADLGRAHSRFDLTRARRPRTQMNGAAVPCHGRRGNHQAASRADPR